MHVVIVGGGAIGSSLAFWLSRFGPRAPQITLLERNSIACAASGKAGGFLARDWGSRLTRQLHEVGFHLHEEIAKELGVESFRKIRTASLSVAKRKGSGKADASWLSKDVQTRPMDDATAQVTPHELVTKLVRAAEANGVKVREGAQVAGLSVSGDELRGVKLSDGEIITCDACVVCCGPWSTAAAEWLGINIPMEGIKSTSVVFTEESHPNLTKLVREDPVALFCDEDDNGCHLEVYPRPDGSVYLCGIGGSDYVKPPRLCSGGDCDDPDKIHPDPSRVAAAVRSFGRMVGIDALDGKDPALQNSCMRPCQPDGLPSLGPAGDVKGTFLATGHNCWGILWCLVSGKAMAELVMDGKASCVDLAPFDPCRFTQGKGARAARRGRAQGAAAVGEQW
jgi:glycine/D-amino acid oxidase-like deaminating enzyme